MLMYQKSMFDRYYCIIYGNVLTINNVEIVSKSLFSIVCRMALMLALLGGVLIMPLSGQTQTSQ